jgi:LytS/YehU family sensor histidine kinase
MPRLLTSLVEKEQLKKTNLQGQYKSLKNQVNPHFLFNPLNSLSSLIADEPQRAEQFVDEMAKVYRHLLQTNRPADTPGRETDLTTLTNELTFIESYFHLLKTRYASGIQLEITIDSADEDRLLPLLTLQVLVEKAVKHNVIHAARPPIIEIKSAPNGHLLVRYLLILLLLFWVETLQAQPLKKRGQLGIAAVAGCGILVVTPGDLKPAQAAAAQRMVMRGMLLV